MEKGLVAGVIAIFLGMLAVFVGWTIVGGLVLGVDCAITSHTLLP
jgi:hypothetical protein